MKRIVPGFSSGWLIEMEVNDLEGGVRKLRVQGRPGAPDCQGALHEAAVHERLETLLAREADASASVGLRAALH